MTELTTRRLQLLKELDIVVNIELNIIQSKNYILNDECDTLENVILTKKSILAELKLIKILNH